MKLIKLFYLKWIRRCCPHLCILCEFRDWCLEDGISGLAKDLEIFIENNPRK